MTRALKPSGSRQRIWTVLLGATQSLPVTEISRRAETDVETCGRYLSALKKAGYAEHEAKEWRLFEEQKTGPIAPTINARGEWRDYNESPAPTPAELERAIKQSGLTINAWAIETGLGPGLPTRLRQMINGKRPIGPSVEDAIAKSKSNQQKK